MLLSKRQRKGFVRLFRSLTIFVANEEDLGERDEGDPGYRKGDALLDAVELIWCRRGGLAWIDDYVSCNPDNLNRRDLAIIASWKDAVATDFCITHVGADCVFLTEEHAFVVRGIDEELFEVIETPDVCWACLLPFDGVVTFAGGLMEPMNPHSGLHGLSERGLGWYRERGRIIRTERQYLKVAPLLRNEAYALVEDAEDAGVGRSGGARADSGVGGDPYEVVAGQHRGVLAGSWGEERDGLALAYLKGHEGEELTVGDLMREQTVLLCEPRPPISSLATVLMTRRRDEIVGLAKWLNLRRYSHLRKEELAREVARFFVEYPKDIVEYLQQHGMLCVEGARMTLEAGGRLDFRLQGIELFTDFPLPCFPFLNGYRMGDVLVAHVPDDVRKALEGVDWAMEAARAHRISRSVHYLEVLVSYRGMVDVAEAFALVARDLGAASLLPHEGQTMLAYVQHTEQVSCRFVKFEGDVSGTYVMDRQLMRESGIDADHKTLDGYFKFDEVMEAQRGIAPRSVSGLGPGDDARSLFLSPGSNPLAREIIEYLDERVPDGGNDCDFAELVLEDVVLDGWQHDFNPDRLHLALTLQGFEGTPAQMRHLEGLFCRLFDAMPRWRNNGWSDADVDAHRL